jgi:phosphoribosylglycinamide formyltransferase-1
LESSGGMKVEKVSIRGDLTLDKKTAIRSVANSDSTADRNLIKGRIAVLASGRGSDFQSIVDAVEVGKVTYEVALLICNEPGAFVIERAKTHSIPFVIISHKGREREDFDVEMDQVLRSAKIDIVVLAGFMRILSDRFVDLWRDRILNIHPALLPSFPGAHPHRDVLDYGAKITGLTIHFVDESMDGGPIIFQHPVLVDDEDTEASLELRVLEKEHEWYPLIIDRVVKGEYFRKGRRVTSLR